MGNESSPAYRHEAIDRGLRSDRRQPRGLALPGVNLLLRYPDQIQMRPSSFPFISW